MKLSLILFLIVFAVSQINSQDFEFSQLDYKNDLWDLHRVHSLDDVVVVAGESGLVRYSFDFGETWDYTIFDVQAINDVFVINDHTIAVACNGSTIFISNDSCKTWNRFQSNDKSNFKALIYNNNKVLAAGTENVLFEYDISSKDHKFTHIESSINIVPEDIEYYDGSKILIVTESGDILFSEDLGQTWSVQYTAANKLKAVKAINADIIYAAGDSLITLKSTNGGVDWEDISPVCEECNFVKPDLISMNFIDEENGVIKVADYYTNDIPDYEYTTEDGGETWYFTGIEGVLHPLRALRHFYYENMERGWAVGRLGGIIKVKLDQYNNSYFFEQINDPNNIPPTRVVAYDRNHLFAFNYDPDLEQALTSDGGETWSSFNLGDIEYYGTLTLRDAVYINENSILISAVGQKSEHKDGVYYIYYKGLLIYTNNGGNTWETAITPDSIPVSDINFYDSQKGILNLYSQIMITTDGGNNWKVINNRQDFDINARSIRFTEPDLIYMWGYIKINDSTSFHKLYKSNDLADSFQEIQTEFPVDFDIHEIIFTNQNTGFLFLYGKMTNSGILRIDVTKDGGKTWEKFFEKETQYYAYFGDIAFRSNTLIFADTENLFGVINTETLELDTFNIFDKFNINNISYLSFQNENFIVATTSQKDFYIGVRNSTGVFEFFGNDNAQTSLYPNPADDLVYFDETQAIEEILILDINSKDMTSLCKANITGETKSIDISNLQSGMYFVIIKLQDKSYYMKFVKM